MEDATEAVESRETDALDAFRCGEEKDDKEEEDPVDEGCLVFVAVGVVGDNWWRM